MNDTPLVLKGCMTIVALSLILQYVVYSWSKVKGRGGGGKVRCHWWGDPTSEKLGGHISTADDSRRCGDKSRTTR